MPTNGKDLERIFNEMPVPKKRKPTRAEREAAEVFGEVLMARLRLQGLAVVGVEAMVQGDYVDDKRRELAGMDSTRNEFLGELEAEVHRGIKGIVRGFVNPMGF